MTRRRLHLLATVLFVAGAAGCGGGEAPAAVETVTVTAEPTKAATASATPKRSAVQPTTEAPAALGTVDVYTCQQFVSTAGEAYGFLTTVEREGSVTVDLSTPGYIDAYQLGGMASLYTEQLESPTLSEAMGRIKDHGSAFRMAIDTQDSPGMSITPLREALDRAAEICEGGGFQVDWN